MLLDMSGWPLVELDVLKELHLDPRNVRLEDADARVEADIMADLFANEDVLGLVDGISKVGYLTHEVPIAIKRRARYVVVEGNRRLSALKAIQNPQLVPEYRARVAALAEQIPDRSFLAKIEVIVAPSEDKAEQLVAAIHTSNLRRPWTPARQTAFFQAQIDSGRSFNALLTRYPTIDVRKFVFRVHILDAFKAVKFRDAALTDYLTTKAWNRGLSVLARIYESKEFLEITGFTMDEHGTVTKTVTNQTFARMAAVIVQGMLEGDLNTRSLNTVRSPRFVKLMSELREIAESERRGSKSISAGRGTTQQSDGSKGKKAGAAGRRESVRGRFLETGHLVFPEAYPLPLRRHFEELSALDVERFPNACFLLMRAMLEKSIKAFAEARGEDIKKGGASDKGWVQLGHALDWLLRYVTDSGRKDLIQPINRVRGGKFTYMATSDSMNAVNHNHKFAVDPEEARHLWDSIDPLLRFLLKP